MLPTPPAFPLTCSSVVAACCCWGGRCRCGCRPRRPTSTSTRSDSSVDASKSEGLREVQALILEYESGFRAGEREQHTERRASEFFGGGRYALPARARAFFTSGCLLHPFHERYTFATTPRAVFRDVFYTPSVIAKSLATASGRAFLCSFTTIPTLPDLCQCHLPEILLALAASSFVLCSPGPCLVCTAAHGVAGRVSLAAAGRSHGPRPEAVCKPLAAIR